MKAQVSDIYPPFGAINIPPLGKHLYIEVSREEFYKELERFKPVFDNESFLAEVPNSRPVLPYKAHPQFTITILGNKITVWTQAIY